MLLLTAACGEEKADAYLPPGATNNGGNNNGNNNGVGMGDAAVDAGGTSGGIDAGGNSGVDMDAGMDAAIRDAGMDAGRDGGKDAGSLGDAGDAAPVDAYVDPGGPVLAILEPTDSIDPAGGFVITSSLLEVVCSALPPPGGDPVNGTNVTIKVYSGTAVMPAITKTASSSADGPGIFKANVDLAALTSGLKRVECTASDSHVPARTTSTSVSMLYDKGPVISIANPLPGSVVAATADVPVKFTVVPTLLDTVDEQAALGTVTLRLNGISVTPQPDPIIPNGYVFTMDFDDLAVFPTATDAVEIEVTASNSRMPTAASRKVSVDIDVDGAGPTVVVSSPVNASFAGKQVNIIATITDALSAVDDSTVRTTITINNVTDTYPMVRTTNNRFEASFQSALYPDRTEITMNVIAEDAPGNETRIPLTVKLDRVPPWVSLDPPMVREAKRQLNGDYWCSGPFDPAGSSALNDLATSFSIARYRAVLWERGIQLQENQIVRPAGIADSTAAMYVQGNTAIPLLIDTDSDGICDSVNVDPPGSTNDPVKLALNKITPTGAADPGQFYSPEASPSTAGTCTFGTTGNLSSFLCSGNSDLRYVPSHTASFPSPTAIVYGVNVAAAPTDPACTGDEWQTSTPGGWACVVASAEDTVGNLGFSKPLRICYDVPAGSGKCPDGVEITAPSCTDGCTLPPEVADVGMPLFLKRN